MPAEIVDADGIAPAEEPGLVETENLDLGLFVQRAQRGAFLVGLAAHGEAGLGDAGIQDARHPAAGRGHEIFVADSGARVRRCSERHTQTKPEYDGCKQMFHDNPPGRVYRHETINNHFHYIRKPGGEQAGRGANLKKGLSFIVKSCIIKFNQPILK